MKCLTSAILRVWDVPFGLKISGYIEFRRALECPKLG
jgi:hypothetical protein